MRAGLWAIVLGISAALLSPALEIITGHPLPYILVLAAFIPLGWWAVSLTRAEMGFRKGLPGPYFVAVFYPIVVTAFLGLMAWRLGGMTFEATPPAELWKELGIMFGGTLVGVLITEEGFYRGTLWGLGERAGWSQIRILFWTSLAFTAWHVAVPIIEVDFRLPADQLPIYYGNVMLIGMSWGLLRMISGSIWVPCLAHAVWNALVYVFFGYGTKTAYLQIDNIAVYDPERGVLGLAANAVVLLLLLQWPRGKKEWHDPRQTDAEEFGSFNS